MRENVSQDEKPNTYGGPRQRKATGTTAEYECATSALREGAGAQARERERTARRPIPVPPRYRLCGLLECTSPFGSSAARRPMHKTSPRGAIGVSREGDTSLSREGGSNDGSNTSGKRWGQTTPNKSRSFFFFFFLNRRFIPRTIVHARSRGEPELCHPGGEQ